MIGYSQAFEGLYGPKRIEGKNKMNERIRKLAEQAELSANQGDHVDVKMMMEKFAELIVRECGVALKPMLRDMVSRGQAYDLIKQHFGVEE